MIDFVSPEVIRVVIADESFSESVKLVGSVEVHSADLYGLVSGDSKSVGERRDSGVEVLGVGPDLVLIRVLSGEH